MGGIASFPGVHEPAHLPPHAAGYDCVCASVRAGLLRSGFPEGGEVGCEWVCPGSWGGEGTGRTVLKFDGTRRGQGPWFVFGCVIAGERGGQGSFVVG